MKEYRWAVLGCGAIANELARAFQTQGRTLYAASNRTQEKAEAFAAQYGIQRVYGDFYEMLADENIDIIYISTPHNTHFHFLLEALKNGKHVLCEKSITLNAGELKQAVNAAEENGLVLAEAMTIYHMPLCKKLHTFIKTGVLGPLRMIQVNFGSYKEYDMANRFYSRDLAGGALLDIGVYALSFIRYFMTEAPNQIVSQVKFAPTGVDEQAGILLMNEQQEMAAVTLSLHAKQPKRAMLAFDKGYIEVYDYPRAQKAVITYTRDGRQEVIEAGSTQDALLYEVLDMERAVSGEADEMLLPYTIDVMRMMTEIRNSWHMKYPEEERELTLK